MLMGVGRDRWCVWAAVLACFVVLVSLGCGSVQRVESSRGATTTDDHSAPSAADEPVEVAADVGVEVETERTANELPSTREADDAAHDDPPATLPSSSLADSFNGFGADLWNRLSANGQRGNAAFSPISLGLGLSMAYLGAREGTAAAFEGVLHLSSGPSATAAQVAELMEMSTTAPGAAVTIANRLYVQDSFRLKPAYVALTRDAFGAAIERVDFVTQAGPTANAINRWVAKTTQGRIPRVVDATMFSRYTRLVLINAIHFKADWARPFLAHETRDLGFFANGGPTQVRVPMMNGPGERYGRHEGVQVMELSYRGGAMAMLFVLPDARDGLPDVEARLDRALFDAWVDAARQRDVYVTLPRFKVETDAIAMNVPLTDLGLGVAFSDNANFGGIHGPSPHRLAISRVVHRAFVEVHERGTEAAAATAVAMDVLLSGHEITAPRFVADHPFLFFIRDRRTNAILFAGRVVDPRR